MLSVADRFSTMRWPGALPGAERIVGSLLRLLYVFMFGALME
jgi:hypothetical protein